MGEAVGAGVAASRAGEVGAARTARLNDPRQSAGAAIVNAPVEKEFTTILQSKDPRAAAKSLALQAARDKTGLATKGLKAAALDHMIKGASKGEGLSGKSIRAAMGDKRTWGALSEILSPDEMQRLGRIAGEMDKLGMADGRLPKVGGVIEDRVNSVINFIGTTLGARQGAKLGAGTSGAALKTASAGSKRVGAILQSLTNDRAEQLLRDAVSDPDLYKSLLMPLDTAAGATQVERRLTEWLGAEIGQTLAPEAGPSAPIANPWESDEMIFDPSKPWQADEEVRSGTGAEMPKGFTPLKSSLGPTDKSIAQAGATAAIPKEVGRVATGPVTAINLAKTFVGKGEAHAARPISAFITRMTGRNIDIRETPWCAAFVNAVLKGSGGSGTGKLNARSFMEFGTSTDSPQTGDVAVFWRGDPNGWQGHVGFYAGEVEKNGQTYVKVVGGNQNDMVSEKLYPKSRLLGYRRPPEVRA